MASNDFQAASKYNKHNLADDEHGSDDASAAFISPVSEEKVTFWDAKVTKKHTVKDTRLRDEDSAAFISGMCMMDSGQIILCDNVNNKLKFLDDISTKVRYDIRCESAPFDVAGLDEDRAVVTVPDTCKLQFVIVRPGAKLDKTVKVSGECYGVTVHEMKIYICLADKGIQIVSDTGMPQIMVPHGSATVPKYICVTADATKICHSGGSHKEAFVSLITNKGHGLIKIADGIENPAGLSIDMEDTFLLLDSGNSKVYAIRNNGEKRCLLSKEAKKYSLTSMDYNYVKRKMAISEIMKSKDGVCVSKIKIYQFEMQPKSRFGTLGRGLLGSIRHKWRK